MADQYIYEYVETSSPGANWMFPISDGVVGHAYNKISTNTLRKVIGAKEYDVNGAVYTAGMVVAHDGVIYQCTATTQGVWDVTKWKAIAMTGFKTEIGNDGDPEKITIGAGFTVVTYGDVTIGVDGILAIESGGKLVILNGALINNGTLQNSGTLLQNVGVQPTTGSQSFNTVIGTPIYTLGTEIGGMDTLTLNFSVTQVVKVAVIWHDGVIDAVLYGVQPLTEAQYTLS